MNALTAFHTATADLSAKANIDWREAQTIIFERMMTQRPDIARKVANALVAEMAR